MKKALAAALLVAVIGPGAFFGARELLVRGAEGPSVDQAVNALEADRVAPRFAGVIAGLTIVPRQGEEYAYDTYCSTPQWEEWSGVEPGYRTGTDLDIPPIRGFNVNDHQVAWCDGRVAFNSVMMVSPAEDAFVTIVRVWAKPVLHKDVPAERVTEASVNGMAVVHVEPVRFGDGLYELSNERLYVVDDFGITNISVEGRVDIFEVAGQILERSP